MIAQLPQKIKPFLKIFLNFFGRWGAALILRLLRRGGNGNLKEFKHISSQNQISSGLMLGTCRAVNMEIINIITQRLSFTTPVKNQALFENFFKFFWEMGCGADFGASAAGRGGRNLKGFKHISSQNRIDSEAGFGDLWRGGNGNLKEFKHISSQNQISSGPILAFAAGLHGNNKHYYVKVIRHNSRKNQALFVNFFKIFWGDGVRR